MLRLAAFILGLAVAACAGAGARSEPFHLISGSVPMDRGPDGNTVVLEAPEGLIVIDTGRHPEHARAILDYAKERGRPVAAIVNTHWHMDHTTGNADIRASFPQAPVYATSAVDGALATFLADGGKNAEARLADPKTPASRLPEIRRFLDRMSHPDSIRPTDPVVLSARMKIAGRRLDVHVAKFAATEGDLWLYEPKSRTAIVGDLVVGLVPFMDTACADGWLAALGEIERTPFTTLTPGHGAVMNRADFLAWKGAFTDFVACGRSSAPKDQCVSGWEKAAARFIDDEHRTYVRDAAAYYIDTRLRSSADEQQKYCRPLSAR